MFFKVKKIAAVALSIIVVTSFTSCARNLGSNVYASSSVAGKVIEGVVVSAKPILIKEKDRVADNGSGTLLGAGSGALAGSAFGAGDGNVAAMIAGGVIGAVAGTYAEDYLGTQEGTEYIVKIKQPKVNSIKKTQIRKTSNTVDDDIKSSIEVQTSETSMISIVMDNSVTFAPGQAVYIVYNNDRPRLTAR